VFSHEFSHLWISRINPEISLVLNEGIAHFVESLCYGKEHLYEELVLAAALPTERHWVAGTPKSDLATYSLRGIGYAVVDYLFKVKRIPLREIPTLSDAQLPEVEEISRHLWDLKLEALKRQVVRTPSVNVAVNVDPQEWLVRTSWTPLNTDAGGTVGAAECWAELEARVRNGVRLLRTQGIDDAEILKVAPTELMKHGLPTLAEDCPSLYLETSLNVAGLMYQGSDGGLCNAALERLISDSYPQSQDSLLQRDCDQAWARVYASKSLDYKGELPEYSPALLEEIRAKVSEMSAVRAGMRAFQNASQQQDKL
jgi:hypothetical protein